MKTHQNENQFLGLITGAGVILALLITISLQSLPGALAQDSSQTTNDIDKKTESMPMCPMMAGMKGIKLTADSPPLLMARADELQLTDVQKQELKSIAEEAQRKATKVLTKQQQSMLGESPGKVMSMMEVAMMRFKDMNDDKSDGMCPMCKKKMDEMMKVEKSDGDKSKPAR